MIQDMHMLLAGVHNQVGKSLFVAFAWRITQAFVILWGGKKHLCISNNTDTQDRIHKSSWMYHFAPTVTFYGKINCSLFKQHHASARILSLESVQYE